MRRAAGRPLPAVSEQRARSLANLRPFQAGQSGNPRGKPPDPLLRQLRKRLTAEEADELVGALLEKAREGDIRALEMIWDRIAGKPVAREERGGPGAFARGFEIRLVRVEDGDGDETAAG